MRPLFAVLAVFFAAAAPAAGKQVVGAKTCGSDGCRAMLDPSPEVLAGTPANAPKGPEPFVLFRILYRGGEEEKEIAVDHVYLVRSGLLVADGRQEGELIFLRPAAETALRREAGRVTPFPAARLPRGVQDEISAASVALAPSQPPSTGGGDGIGAWWIPILTGPLALAAGLAWTRRRRAGPPVRAPAG